MKIFFFALILAFVSCGTSHNYTNNTLDKNYYSDKIIYFKLNPQSKYKINLSGTFVEFLGRVKQPDVEETFRLSIEELSKETNFKLIYVDDFEGLNKDNSLMIDALISEIEWHFGFSIATLKTVIMYRNINNSNEIKAIGIRKSGGGNEKNNLRKSLKDATYNFLKELEKQK